MTANSSHNGQSRSQRTAHLLFACAFVCFSIFLLSKIGAEAKFSSTGKFFAQPALWPAIGIVGMLGFGLGHLWSVWSKRQDHHTGHEPSDLRPAQLDIERDGIHAWFGVFEYYFWFMVYVNVVPLAGYLISTILFTALLAVRAGYRSRRLLGLAALAGFLIVFVFKTLLAVRIPAGAWYEYLPDAIRNFLITNF